MKRIKLWIIVLLSVILTSSALIAFAMESFKVIPSEPAKVERLPSPPENATVITDLGSIPFELSLNSDRITVSKGRSRL